MWNGNKWYWCSKETGGKCEGRWVRHAPNSCQGKAFKGFKKRGTVKEAPKSERVEQKKNKKQEEHEDERGRKYKRLTAAFATTYNEANNSTNSSDNDE